MTTPSIEDLEKWSELASARLGVAEDLGWVIGFLAALAVYLKWHLPWYAVIPLGFVVYFLARHPYLKAEEAATDAYHRATGMGRHFRSHDVDDAT